MLYLIASDPAIIEKIENGVIDYHEYDYYDISSYKVLKYPYTADELNSDSDSDSDDSKPINKERIELKKHSYYNNDDIYVYMMNKDENDIKDFWEYILIEKFNNFVTKSIIHELETKQKEYYECNIMLDGNTTQDDYRCREIEDYKMRIYDDQHDKRKSVGYDGYDSDEDAEPRIIKKFIKDRITVGCCNGKYVTFNVPKLVTITEDDASDDDRSGSYTSVEGNFKILVIRD